MSNDSRRRPMVRLGWLVAAAAVVIAAVTSFGYLGGFLAPDEDARGLPIDVVNLDEGATAGTTAVSFGDDVLTQLRAPNPQLGDAVAWDAVGSRDEAVERLRRDRSYAALVIPADFSARLVAIATSNETRPATIEVLTNPASGSYSGAYSQAVAVAAVEQVSRRASEQLAGTLAGLGATLSPASAAAVGRPVQAEVTVAHPTGKRGGRGLAPFYFAVVVVVATLFTTSTVNVVVDVAAGRQPLAVLGRPVRLGGVGPGVGPADLLRAKLALAVPAAAVVALTVTAVAVGPLDMTVERPWPLAAFAALGALAAAALTLALYTVFDLAGSVLAALFLVIYGVPASAGVYPVEALPAFFRFLHGWLPLRYVSDGARALAFGAGPSGGAARASAVLVAYAAVGVVVALLAARHAGRVEARPAVVGKPQPGSVARADAPAPASAHDRR